MSWSLISPQSRIEWTEYNVFLRLLVSLSWRLDTWNWNGNYSIFQNKSWHYLSQNHLFSFQTTSGQELLLKVILTKPFRYFVRDGCRIWWWSLCKNLLFLSICYCLILGLILRIERNHPMHFWLNYCMQEMIQQCVNVSLKEVVPVD